MKAAVYYSNSDIRTENVEDLSVGPGEIKVKIMACGVCGSDVMEWYRIKRAGRPGGIGAFGHECTGIIADIIMPEMSGFNVAYQLKHIPATRAIPIIVLTSMDIDEETQTQLGGYVSGLMSKSSFTKRDLLREITNIESLR